MASICWATFVGFTVIGAAYETWHLVDVPSIVCPEAVDYAEGFPRYQIGIDFATALDNNVPHVFSILRTSGKPVTVTFEVQDKNGVIVIPSTTVALKNLSAPDAETNCGCTSQTYEDLASGFPSGYGGSCSDWDNEACPQLWSAPMHQTGPWCCEKWCYASSTCSDALTSSLITGGFYSYKACVSEPKSSCSYELPSPCACKANVANFFTDDMRSKFPGDYGSACKNWDEANCDTNYKPEELDDWCCSYWCYVDEECSTAIPSTNDKVQLWWSTQPCEQNISKILQCPYRPLVIATPDNLNKCGCLNITVDSVIRNKYSLPESYGKQCGTHDAYECQKFNPGSTTDLWCCVSWCWVDASCPDRQPSVLWPGKFFSGLNCEADEDVLVNCAWSDSCRCTGDNTGFVADMNGKSNSKSGSFSGFALPQDYGQSCKAWDNVDCVHMWGPDSGEFNLWVMNGKNDWCCKTWCYVSPKCPIAVESRLGAPPYLYAACNNVTSVERAYYDDSSDTCVDIPESKIQPQGVMSFCACLGESPPSLPEGAPADYGSSCQAWDAQRCETYYPQGTYDMWCCLPWCYVDWRCPNAQNSSIWPGHFYSKQYSDLTCDVNIFAQSIRECKYSDACNCLGSNGMLTESPPENFPPVPVDYGTKCSDWDSEECFSKWGANRDVWDSSPNASNDWCCMNWCYVSFACPIAWGPMDNGMAYTYEAACEPNGRSYSGGSTGRCEDRRLTATDENSNALLEKSRTAISEDTHALEGASETRHVPAEEVIFDSDKWWTCRRRRVTICGNQCCCDDGSSQCMERTISEEHELGMIRQTDVIEEEELDFLWALLPTRSRRGKGSSGGGRSGGGGGWFGGGGGGSSRTRAPPDSRRRTPSRPVAASPRRRISVSRASNAAGTLRRRAKSTPGGTTPRRRSRSISGSTWQTPSAGNAYGYTSRPTLMNNYGGTMPSQTNYGYSGRHAYPANYRPQVAMYSPGHYRYNSYNSYDHYDDDDNYYYRGSGGWHSYYMVHRSDSPRRRSPRTEWCIIPSSCAIGPGKIMECSACYDSCGGTTCSSTSDCYSGIGCQYTTPEAVNRDDLMGTGFLPKNFEGPLTVTVTSITGDGFDKETICPKPGDTSPQYSADLFLTLAEQDFLGEAETGPTPSQFGNPVSGKDEAGKTYYDFQAKSSSCMKSLVQWGCTVAGKPGDCTGENEECKLTGDPYDNMGGTPELMCICATNWCAENAGTQKAVCIPPAAATSGESATTNSASVVVLSIAIAAFRA